MSNNIVRGQVTDVHAFYVIEHFERCAQPRCSGWQVDLGDIARDHHSRVEPESGQEHLHLLRSRVLSFIQDYERVVQGAATHVCQWCNFDCSASHQFWHSLWVKHFVKRIEKRAQVWVDLVVERSGQESKSLACLYRRSSQYDATYFFALQRLHCLSHSEISLSGSGRANSEDDGVFINCIYIELLPESLGSDAFAPRRENALAQHIGWACGGFIEHFGRAREVLRCQLLTSGD